MFRSITRAFAAAVLVALIGMPVAAQQPATGAEAVNFERATTHAELMAFLAEVQARSPHMQLVELTRTNEGRVLPLVLLGNPAPGNPGTAWLSGKPTVFITGNVHGNERAGREGSLQLIRELAVGDLRPLLERVNVLIVPTLNPDGAERPSRTNTLGYDMNRDFMVMETPEITGIVEGVLTEWWPDIYVDVHNGGAYPYNMTYQPTLHPDASEQLRAFALGPLFRGVNGHLETQGMKSYWYSGPRLDQATGDWSWTTTPIWARKQHVYGGLQNMVTLLFEIPGGWSLGDQADNARESLEGLLRYAADNPERVRDVVLTARAEALAGAGPIAIELEEQAYPERESFWVIPRGEGGERGEPELVQGWNRTLYVPTETRARPWAYAFNGSLDRLADHLRRHAIDVEQLTAEVELPVEQYRLTRLAWEPEPYQGHNLVSADMALEPATVTLPAGTYLVRTRQNASRLIGQMMEADTEDSVLRWNWLDHFLPGPFEEGVEQRRPAILPLYRIAGPASVRSVLLK